MHKLYSVLLTKDNTRIIYINLTELEMQVKVNKYNDYHSVVVEQAQDKGIQIIIKS